jgi:hypothetical protein
LLVVYIRNQLALQAKESCPSRSLGIIRRYPSLNRVVVGLRVVSDPESGYPGYGIDTLLSRFCGLCVSCGISCVVVSFVRWLLFLFFSCIVITSSLLIHAQHTHDGGSYKKSYGSGVCCNMQTFCDILAALDSSRYISSSSLLFAARCLAATCECIQWLIYN